MDSAMAARGEAEARDRFRALYEANYHAVLGYALRRASASDAADVVADTFLAAWRRLGDVPEGDAARLWLYGTARRVLANQRRSERRRGRLEGKLRELRRLESETTERPTGGAVAAAFARLRPGDRELLALAGWEGLDPGEIAAVLGCSRNAARIRLHRARARFARELGRRPAKREPAAGHVQATPLRAEDVL